MKTIILVLALVAIASAIPKPSKVHFRNLYKQPKAVPKLAVKARIIGGQEAEINQFPYQAFFEFYDSDSGWYCGGSLISQNYVLTAGHCGENALEAHVTLGAHRALEQEESQVRLVSNNITVHPGWNRALLINDLSIVQLPESVNLTEAIGTVTLPSRNTSSDFAGEIATVSGWGLTDGFGDSLSEVLNFVDVEVISNNECEDFFGELEDTIICTSGDEETGSCSGDSGGPLVIDNVQIGIVSYGIIFCLPEYPSAFTRVTSYLDWIADNSDVVIA